jgi:hypothetical protein
MPQVGFQPTIPVVVRAKTVHALDHAATVINKHDSSTDIFNNKTTSILCIYKGCLRTGCCAKYYTYLA